MQSPWPRYDSFPVGPFMSTTWPRGRMSSSCVIFGLPPDLMDDDVAVSVG